MTYMASNYSKVVTIFEGCDGSGKTTAAKLYAQATGARYVHFSALPRVREGLPRLYIEAMLPALLGYQDVVLDRCWLSEEPYGLAFRPNNSLRVDAVDQAMLERVALRCAAVVVHCDPGFDVALGNFRARREREMLDNGDQLKSVYDLYRNPSTPSALDRVCYNYVTDYSEGSLNLVELTSIVRSMPHRLCANTAGDAEPKALLVGQSFAEVKEQDCLSQYPFVSFSDVGCSRWFTGQLAQDQINEQKLGWANADMDPRVLQDFADSVGPGRVIALGNSAKVELLKLGIDAIEYPHPMYWKRFCSGPHPVVETLKTFGAQHESIL